MSVAMTRRQVEALARSASSAKARARNIANEMAETVNQAIYAAETGGAAFGLAFMHTYWPESREIGGMPTDLLAAAVLHLGAFAKKGADPHWHALANGALASWAVKQGHKVATEMREGGGTAAGYSDAAMESLAR